MDDVGRDTQDPHIRCQPLRGYLSGVRTKQPPVHSFRFLLLVKVVLTGAHVDGGLLAVL